MIYYFSGCGNSRWLAEGLAEATQDRVCFIPETMKHNSVVELQSDERLGFVFPVYAWAPPEIVMQFVKRLQVSRVPTYLYLACTCGDEAGLTEKIFRKALRRKGWHLDAAFSFVMPETYINLPGFRLDTKENECSKLKAAEQRLLDVAQRINRKESPCSDMKVGKASWLKSRIVQPLFQSCLITDRLFRAESYCVSCGECEAVCPVANIRLVEGKPKWRHRCVGCMACYHHCPVNAIQFGRHTKGKGQYYWGHQNG